MWPWASRLSSLCLSVLTRKIATVIEVTSLRYCVQRCCAYWLLKATAWSRVWQKIESQLNMAPGTNRYLSTISHIFIIALSLSGLSFLWWDQSTSLLPRISSSTSAFSFHPPLQPGSSGRWQECCWCGQNQWSVSLPELIFQSGCLDLHRHTHTHTRTHTHTLPWVRKEAWTTHRVLKGEEISCELEVSLFTVQTVWILSIITQLVISPEVIKKKKMMRVFVVGEYTSVSCVQWAWGGVIK